MKRYYSSKEGIGVIMAKAVPAVSGSFGLSAKATRSLVMVSCLFFGAVAFYAVSGARDAFAAESSVGMPAIQSLYAIGRAMMTIDGAENALLATDIDESKRRSIYSQFDAARRSLDESLKAYEGLPLSAKESRLWKDFVRALETWGKDHERFVQLAVEHDRGRTTETYSSMSRQALEVNQASLSAAVSLLDALVEGSLGRREETNEAAVVSAASPYQEYIVQVTVVVGSVLALVIILLIVRRAMRPHRRFATGGRRLTLDVDTRGKVFSSVRSAENSPEACPAGKPKEKNPGFPVQGKDSWGANQVLRCAMVRIFFLPEAFPGFGTSCKLLDLWDNPMTRYDEEPRRQSRI